MEVIEGGGQEPEELLTITEAAARAAEALGISPEEALKMMMEDLGTERLPASYHDYKTGKISNDPGQEPLPWSKWLPERFRYWFCLKLLRFALDFMPDGTARLMLIDYYMEWWDMMNEVAEGAGNKLAKEANPDLPRIPAERKYGNYNLDRIPDILRQ